MSDVIPPVIKWSGSKRSQSASILSLFPKSFFPSFSQSVPHTYYEPFLGGGSILAKMLSMFGINRMDENNTPSLNSIPDNQIICSDICKPLINFWNVLKNDPQSLIDSYDSNWRILQEKGYSHYYHVRDSFNESLSNPHDFLFLSRTCVSGLIRFNQKGKFNSSFHHNRHGINPKTLSGIIMSWHKMIQKVTFIHSDYRDILKSAVKGDLVYLDPPYFGTVGMYYGKIIFDELVQCLESLNKNEVNYILSYDGMTGSEDHTVYISENLFERHILLDFGNSSFNRIVNGKNKHVKESVYLNYL